MWSFEKAELETLDHILFVFLPLKFKLCWLVCWFLDRLRTRRTLLAKSVSSCTSPSLLGTSSGSCPGWMWSCRYVHQGSQTNFYRTKFYRHFSTDIFLPRHFPTRGTIFYQDIFLLGHFSTRTFSTKTFFYHDFFWSWNFYVRLDYVRLGKVRWG